MTTKTIFWCIIAIAALAIVTLLGTIVNIGNPVTWITYIAIAAGGLIAGYVLGRKAEK